jgi:VWFA-related protein
MVSTTGGRRTVLPPSVDRAELRKAITALQFQPYGREEMEQDWAARLNTPYAQDRDLLTMGGLWAERFVLDSLAAIEGAVRYLRGQPGRKALVLASEGFSLPTQLGRVPALDPRGLTTIGIGAQDRVEPPNAAAYNAELGRRRQALRQDEWSLQRLPAETGGLAITNSNDVLDGLRRIVADLAGYYLVGYEPEGATFGGRRDQPDFRKLTVKVRRPGLKVRTRRGFYAVSDEALAAAATP